MGREGGEGVGWYSAVLVDNGIYDGLGSLSKESFGGECGEVLLVVGCYYGVWWSLLVVSV